MAQPQLGLILITIEAKGEQSSVAELRRLAQKILETNFTETSDRILEIQSDDGEEEEAAHFSDQNSGEGNEYEGDVVDCFLGEPDGIYRLRK